MRFIKWAVFGLIAIGAFGVGYVMFSAMGKPDAGGLERYARGELARLEFRADAPPRPTTIFIGPDGYGMTLEDFGRKALLVNFWATWCAPCIEEMPSLARLQQLKGDDRFEVVAISMDKAGDADDARLFLDELTGGVLPFYHDPNFAMPFRVEASEGFPVTIIYGPAGNELARFAGGAGWSGEDALMLVDAVKGR